MRTSFRTTRSARVAANVHPADSVTAVLAVPAQAQVNHPFLRALKPSPLPAGCALRVALLDDLTKSPPKQLTTLIAPAGSGKTTLLTQLSAHLRQRAASPDELAFAWLRVDRNTHTAAMLLQHLHYALMASQQFRQYRADRGVSAQSFCECLHVVAQRHARVYFVLDDVHWLASAEFAAELLFVLTHSPDNVYWMLAGRALPAINVADFALRDQLLEVEGSRLDLDPAQISELAKALGREPFSEDDAQRIYSSTEGWMAGVRFALLAPHLATAELLRRYFDDVLLQETAAVNEFLQASAIVDRLEVELCNALCGFDTSSALLDHIEHAQLFARRVADQAITLRLHPMFREYLLERLRREQPQRIADLHLRASRWFASVDRFEAALHHAFLSGHREWCVHLTARAARQWTKAGAIAQTLAWTNKLDRSELFAHEHLWTAHITCLILSRRFTQAANELSSASANPNTSGKLRTLKLMLGLLSNRISDVEMAEQGLADNGVQAEGPELTATLMNLQAYWLIKHQRFEAARRRALQARDCSENQGSHYGATYASAVLCAALGAIYHNQAAVEHAERCFGLHAYGPRNAVWANAATTLAQVRYEQNSLLEAGELCREVLPLLTSVSSLHNFATAHIVAARVHAANHEWRAAETLLDDLHGYLETGYFPLGLADVCVEKMRLYLLQGQMANAEALAAEFTLDLHQVRNAWQWPVRPHASDEQAATARLGCAQALLFLHLHQHDQCATLLDFLLAQAQHVGFKQRVILLLALRAALLAKTNSVAMAYTTLNEALMLTRSAHTAAAGFTRGIYDEVPGLVALVRQAIAANALQPPLPPQHVVKFADLLGIVTTSSALPRRRSAHTPSVLLESLTDREMTVLQLLAQGLSNQQICERSNIAITTTKWHLKNIFSKLNVGTRTAALARARALQLIN